MDIGKIVKIDIREIPDLIPKWENPSPSPEQSPVQQPAKEPEKVE